MSAVRHRECQQGSWVGTQAGDSTGWLGCAGDSDRVGEAFSAWAHVCGHGPRFWGEADPAPHVCTLHVKETTQVGYLEARGPFSHKSVSSCPPVFPPSTPKDDMQAHVIEPMPSPPSCSYVPSHHKCFSKVPLLPG